MMSQFYSLKTRLSSDVIKMVDEGASRDEIMIHVGMLLMLDRLDYAFRDFFADSRSELSQEGSGPFEDEDGNWIQFRSIVKNVAATSLYN